MAVLKGGNGGPASPDGHSMDSGPSVIAMERNAGFRRLAGSGLAPGVAP